MQSGTPVGRARGTPAAAWRPSRLASRPEVSLAWGLFAIFGWYYCTLLSPVLVFQWLAAPSAVWSASYLLSLSFFYTFETTPAALIFSIVQIHIECANVHHATDLSKGLAPTKVKHAFCSSR